MYLITHPNFTGTMEINALPWVCRDGKITTLFHNPPGPNQSMSQDKDGYWIITRMTGVGIGGKIYTLGRRLARWGIWDRVLARHHSPQVLLVFLHGQHGKCIPQYNWNLCISIDIISKGVTQMHRWKFYFNTLNSFFWINLLRMSDVYMHW